MIVVECDYRENEYRVPCVCKVTSMPRPVPTCVEIARSGSINPEGGQQLPRATLAVAGVWVCGIIVWYRRPGARGHTAALRAERVQAQISGCRKKDEGMLNHPPGTMMSFLVRPSSRAGSH